MQTTASSMKTLASSQCFKQQRVPRQACRVQCAALPPAEAARRAAAGALLSAAAAATLLLPAGPALAVSGGGGGGNSLAFADLSGQDLRKNKYLKADMRGANLSGANLEGVNLFGALCTNANFTGANLRNADLELVELEGADLSDAVLEGAMLTNAQFGRVKSIKGADFSDVLIRKDVQNGLCKIADGVNPTTGVATRDSLPSYTSLPLPGRPAAARRCEGPVARRTAARAEQQQQDRPAALGAGGSDGSGGKSSPVDHELIESALHEYDAYIELYKQRVEEGQKFAKNLDKEIAKMKEDGFMPGWFMRLAAWSRRANGETQAAAQQKCDALQAARPAFAAALRTLEAELQTAPSPISGQYDETLGSWLALAGYNWASLKADNEGEQQPSEEDLQELLRGAVQSNSGEGTLLWVACASSLLTAWLAGVAGEWAGYDAYRLLHDLPGPGAAAAWLAWTAPYVAGTVVSQAVAGGTLGKSIFRPLAIDQDTFFRRLPLLSFAPAALIFAYCQCLVYQGLAQDVFTAALGGVRDPLLALGAVSDPSVLPSASELQPLMGTLSGGLRLPAFVVAPSAAVLTAALESGWFWVALSLRDESSSITLFGETMSAEEWLNGDAGRVEPSNITRDERLLICSRVALSSAYLAVETSVTGSLWLSAATSAAGLIPADLLNHFKQNRKAALLGGAVVAACVALSLAFLGLRSRGACSFAAGPPGLFLCSPRKPGRAALVHVQRSEGWLWGRRQVDHWTLVLTRDAPRAGALLRSLHSRLRRPKRGAAEAPPQLDLVVLTSVDAARALPALLKAFPGALVAAAAGMQPMLAAGDVPQLPADASLPLHHFLPLAGERGDVAAAAAAAGGGMKRALKWLPRGTLSFVAGAVNGSVALLHNPSGVLLAGEAVAPARGRRLKVPSSHKGADVAGQQAAAKRLMGEEGYAYLLPSKGGNYSRQHAVELVQGWAEEGGKGADGGGGGGTFKVGGEEAVGAGDTADTAAAGLGLSPLKAAASGGPHGNGGIPADGRAGAEL
ncbi:pentapeptide repeat [Micractinium conductrix]|uniref:Pentapeptide repeat n=1 Tax=Micractinium conductrix TaxID=554055 RepID=A0A2P6V209_9CHLO|nr:pentapeptide repeat [Micractinium conductrix]|eukprot:PSC68128.1 pentapeptide repeat [Micractinium conductrix]